MNINYKLIGEGEKTVLFLHGWGANLNSFLFCENVLKNNFKLLLVDFPGFGKSDKIRYAFSLFDYALEIFKLIKKLELKNINIVCHSFGGRVAILLATIFNLKINKIVFMGSAGVRPRFNILTKLKILWFKTKKVLNATKIFNFNLAKSGSADYIALNQIEKQSFNKIVNFHLDCYLKKIESQVLIIWGEKDGSTPFYMAKKMHKKIKSSKLVKIENGGHFCFLEYPNIVSSEIAYFLIFDNEVICQH